MTGFTPETEACLACHPSQKDAEPMTDKTVDEAVERVKAYVASWDGFDDGTIISDNCDPNDLILSDLRALLSALELGSVASLPRHLPRGDATPLRVAAQALLDQFDAFKKSDLNHADFHNLVCRYPLWNALQAALSASTTDSGKVDHYRDDTALKFPTGEGGGS